MSPLTSLGVFSNTSQICCPTATNLISYPITSFPTTIWHLQIIIARFLECRIAVVGIGILTHANFPPSYMPYRFIVQSIGGIKNKSAQVNFWSETSPP